MAHGDLTRKTHQDVKAYGHDAMNDNKVEEINGKAQNVRLGHDPGQDEKENKKEKRAN
jgi:hypothetical protein